MLQYNCTINGALKDWIVTEFQQSSEEISVTKFGTISPSSDPDYTVTFTGYTDPYLSSSLSLVATVQSDKTEITCRNQIDQMLIQCTVQITGKHYRLLNVEIVIISCRSSRSCCQCNYSSNCSGQCYCHMVPS